VSGFWLPAVEKTDALVADLLVRSGAAVADETAFKQGVIFRNSAEQITASVGSRWRTIHPGSTRDERRSRRPWFVFAIVVAEREFVIWKLDIGTPRRTGDGWQIAAHVPEEQVISVRDFPVDGGGGLIAVIRRGAPR